MKPIPFDHWPVPYINLAIQAMKDHVAEHSGLSYVEPEMVETVWQRLRSGELRAAIIGGYLFVYDVGPLWWGKTEYVHECLLRRILPEGNFNDAIDGMVYIANINNCAGIVSGNGIHRPGLRRLYERRGFRKMNETYFLEVTHERGEEDRQCGQEG